MAAVKLPKKRTFAANAPLWKRVLALMVDLIIVDFFILSFFRKSFENAIPKGSFMETYQYVLSNPSVVKMTYSLLIPLTILIILYFSILEYKLGQTLGKYLLNLKLVSAKKELKLWQVLVRNIYLIPIFPFILLWIVNPIYILVNKEKQSLTEQISYTKVIEEVAMT